jgi:hypothetical protein
MTSASQVKYPSLLTDFNQTSTACDRRAVGARYGVTVTSLQWNTRYRRKITVASKQSGFHYWETSQKLPMLVAHPQTMLSWAFQLHNCNTRRDKDEKLMSLASHCSGFTETSQVALPTHVLQAVPVWSISVENERQFTREAESFSSLLCLELQWGDPKRHTWHYLTIRNKQY